MKYLSIFTVALMVVLAGTVKKVYIPDGIVVGHFVPLVSRLVSVFLM